MGSREPERLLESGEFKFPSSVSPDGKLLAYGRVNKDTGWDLWILPLDGERKPEAFIQTEFNEGRGMFSPDGEWIAYVSDESGRNEVYVDAFPNKGKKQQLSSEGVTLVWWRDDGKELFYQEPDGRVMAMGVEARGDHLAFGEAALLFEVPPPTQEGNISPFSNGQRFLLAKPAEEEIPQPLNLIVNWTAALER